MSRVDASLRAYSRDPGLKLAVLWTSVILWVIPGAYALSAGVPNTWVVSGVAAGTLAVSLVLPALMLFTKGVGPSAPPRYNWRKLAEVVQSPLTRFLDEPAWIDFLERVNLESGETMLPRSHGPLTVELYRAFRVEIGVHPGMQVVAESQSTFDLYRRAIAIHDAPATIVFITGDRGTGKSMLARWMHSTVVRTRVSHLRVLSCPEMSVRHAEDLFFNFGHWHSHSGQGTGDWMLLEEASCLRTHVHERLALAVSERAKGDLSHGLPSPRIILTSRLPLGQWREDTYDRLLGSEYLRHFHVPPLAERREDILPLVLHYLKSLRRSYDSPVVDIDPAGLAFLRELPWPGNTTQLRGVVENLLMTCFRKTARLRDVIRATSGRIEL